MSNISAEDFVVLWNTFNDAKKLANVLGLSHDAVRSRACRLRQKGYDLPKLKRGPLKVAGGPGAHVRELRFAAGMNQGELARALGVSQPTVSRVELGKVHIKAIGGIEAVRRVTESAV